MSKNFKTVTGPGGVLLDPNGFWEKISGTLPTVPDDGIGMWVRREGTGYSGFGGRCLIFFFTPNGTANDVTVWVDFSTLTYKLTVPSGTYDSGVSSTLNQWDHVALDVDGNGTTSDVRLIINGTVGVTRTAEAFSWPSLFGFFLAADSNAFDPDKFDGSIDAPIAYQASQGSGAASFWNTQLTTGFAPVVTTAEYSYVRMAPGGSPTVDTSGNGNDYTDNGTSQDGASPEPTFPTAATIVDLAQADAQARLRRIRGDAYFSGVMPSIPAAPAGSVAFVAAAEPRARGRSPMSYADVIPPIFSKSTVEVAPVVAMGRPRPRGPSDRGDVVPPLFRLLGGFEEVIASAWPKPKGPSDKGDVVPPLFRLLGGFEPVLAPGWPRPRGPSDRGDVVPPLFQLLGGFEPVLAGGWPRPRGPSDRGDVVPPLFVRLGGFEPAIALGWPRPRGPSDRGDVVPPLFRLLGGYEPVATSWWPRPRGIGEGTLVLRSVALPGPTPWGPDLALAARAWRPPGLGTVSTDPLRSPVNPAPTAWGYPLGGDPAARRPRGQAFGADPLPPVLGFAPSFELAIALAQRAPRPPTPGDAPLVPPIFLPAGYEQASAERGRQYRGAAAGLEALGAVKAALWAEQAIADRVLRRIAMPAPDILPVAPPRGMLVEPVEARRRLWRPPAPPAPESPSWRFGPPPPVLPWGYDTFRADRMQPNPKRLMMDAATAVFLAMYRQPIIMVRSGSTKAERVDGSSGPTRAEKVSP
jgi:hypothetical protein